MKNPNNFIRLEIAFKWLGFLMLGATALTLINSAMEITPTNFSLLAQLKNLISFLTQAFFMLLVAQLFSLIRSVVGKQDKYGKRLMNVTCIGFVLQGSLSFAERVQIMLTFPSWKSSNGSLDFLMIITNYASALSQLIPLLYAMAVFVLYRYFEKNVIPLEDNK